MTDEAFRRAVESGVVGMTRHAAAKLQLKLHEAYRLVTGSTVYGLLSDRRTGIFLMTNDELGELWDEERSGRLGEALREKLDLPGA